MSISDCIQIIENRFYSNSNLVLQYNKSDIKTEKDDGNNLFYPSLKEKTNQIPETLSQDAILQYQKSLDKCQIVQNSQPYINDRYFNSNVEYKLRDNTTNVKTETENSFLNSPIRMENISNTRGHNRIDNGDSSVTDSKGPATKKCKVCSDKAVNQNFGVLSCESCKAFFRRNAIRSSPLKCSNGTDLCNVTSTTRKQCPSCRLKKCLTVGMRSELIQIRKNNPKVNSNKRKSNIIPQDGSQPKWMNRNSNGSNSSGRLSQDNGDETHHKGQPSVVGNGDQGQVNESSMIQSALWLDPNNFHSQISHHTSNFWVSMNNSGPCEATIKANILSTNYQSNVTNTGINSLSQRFDPIKYDLQIPMIKIKTSQNILQPIALLPAINGSLYATSNVQPIYSGNGDPKCREISSDPLLTNEIVTELSMQTFYSPNTPNYSMPDPNVKSLAPSHPSAFYPFNIQSNNSSTPTIFYNGLSNGDLKNTYLWDCCTMPTSDSSINTDHNSFISMDSGSDPLYSSHTYPNSSSSSQKFYLSPDKYDGSDNNTCFMTIEGHEDIHEPDLHEKSSNTDMNYLFNSVFDSSILSLNTSPSHEHQFIFQIGHIWENTLGKGVAFVNYNRVNVDLNLNPTQYGSLESVKSLTPTHNWEFEFINLSEIFMCQVRSFLSQVVDMICLENDLLETLTVELRAILNDPLKTSMWVLMPVVFSNFILSQSNMSDECLNLDKEVENYLFQDSGSQGIVGDACDSIVANFTVEQNNGTCQDNSKCHLDLSLLSARLLDLNHVHYSSLQYLDKYCSGLCNFLNPSPVLFGLFSLLKLIIMRTNIDYCDVNWNQCLLKRDASKLLIGDEKIAHLIYYLKRIFLTVCDMVQTDTIEQRLQSLDQFLSWSKSQFDMQWMDFYDDTVRSQPKYDRDSVDLFAVSSSSRSDNKVEDENFLYY